MKKIFLVFTFAMALFALKATAQTTGTGQDTASVFNIADSSTFVGKYRYEGLPFEYMTVSVQDGKLYYSGGEYSGTLEPVKDKKDTFDANGEAIFTFVRDAENKVTQMRIDYQGQSYMGERELEQK